MTTIAKPEPTGATESAALPSLPRFEKQKLFTISLRCGQLANRLIIFANFVALAEEQGHKLINFTFQSSSELFDGSCGNVHCRHRRPKYWSWRTGSGRVRLPAQNAATLHLTRATAVIARMRPKARHGCAADASRRR